MLSGGRRMRETTDAGASPAHMALPQPHGVCCVGWVFPVPPLFERTKLSWSAYWYCGGLHMG
jgi:DsbC/DsbD-like thiol-disulfide interchange protein